MHARGRFNLGTADRRSRTCPAGCAKPASLRRFLEQGRLPQLTTRCVVPCGSVAALMSAIHLAHSSSCSFAHSASRHIRGAGRLGSGQQGGSRLRCSTQVDTARGQVVGLRVGPSCPCPRQHCYLLVCYVQESGSLPAHRTCSG